MDWFSWYKHRTWTFGGISFQFNSSNSWVPKDYVVRSGRDGWLQARCWRLRKKLTQARAGASTWVIGKHTIISPTKLTGVTTGELEMRSVWVVNTVALVEAVRSLRGDSLNGALIAVEKVRTQLWGNLLRILLLSKKLTMLANYVNHACRLQAVASIQCRQLPLSWGLSTYIISRTF